MIVLASTSSARAAMLTAAGVKFTAHAPNVDEAAVKSSLIADNCRAGQIADALAEAKAVKLSRRFGDTLVLGADQLLVGPDGAVHDKPGDAVGAERQLRQLAGGDHQLIAAAVVAENGRAVWRASDTAQLTMRPLSAEFIADYLAREGPAVLGCVGSYRIEGLGAQLFTRVVGDPFTIQGLPMLAVLAYLRIRGVLAT